MTTALTSPVEIRLVQEVYNSKNRFAMTAAMLVKDAPCKGVVKLPDTRAGKCTELLCPMGKLLDPGVRACLHFEPWAVFRYPYFHEYT